MMKLHYTGASFIPFKLFCLIFFLGIILFIVWAIRTLDKKQLKNWVIGLLVVGLLGMIGSAFFMGKWKGDIKGGNWEFSKCEKAEELSETPES
jgi:glucan phosphoethanolaminetransferase (alkaline phosphatase superfamily)